MVVTRKNDEAVSPVIGVILMVAITVILAAVIAAFVFGMSGNIQKTKIIALTVQQPSASNITISYSGGQDAGTFVFMNATVYDSAGTVASQTVGSATATVPISVGTVMRFSGSFAGRDQVVVVGRWSDGSEQVVTDTYV